MWNNVGETQSKSRSSWEILSVLKEQAFRMQVMPQHICVCESVVACSVQKPFWCQLLGYSRFCLPSSWAFIIAEWKQWDIWVLFHQTEKCKPLLKTLFKYFPLFCSLNSFIFLFPISHGIFFTTKEKYRSRRRQMGWIWEKESEWS